ncbi:hypothetical protein ABZ951_27170 [Streptomyces sp. NPDC046215]|uniref:Uncharacterized protein n=1 Tax=Streptomyces stramineus TaxID=173861 RepID=A0ABP3J758_9ACTN
MRRGWEPEDLIEVWTLLEEEQHRVRHSGGGKARSGPFPHDLQPDALCEELIEAGQARPSF